MSLLTSLLILFTILLAQFSFTAMFYALANSRKKTLREWQESGRAGAGRTLKLLENSSTLLTSQQYISILLSMCGAAVLTLAIVPEVAAIFDRLELGQTQVSNNETNGELWAKALAFFVLMPTFALLKLVVGTQLPGSVMAGRTEGIALISTPVIRVIMTLLTPALRFSQAVSQRVGLLVGGSGAVSVVTEEEIKTLVDAGSQEGVIESEEKEMIYSVFKFGDTVVREVMVPRIDIVALEIESTLDDALDKIIREGHSRIPIYEETIDNIRGFLYAKDLLTFWRRKEDTFDLASLIREPYFVPESKNADELLEEFQNRETHIAVVIDEYGGTAGLVTIEDLIEEIVGEIRDEYDFFEEEPYQEISENEYVFKAGIDLDDVNDLLDTNFPTDENDTLGGYVFSEIGKIPKVGDKLEQLGVAIEVVSVKGRRISKVRVRKIPKEDTETNLSSETEATTSR